jgi:molecular chaperone GrpE
MSDNDGSSRQDASKRDGSATTPTTAPAQSVADLEAELTATKDRLLRSLAEQENIRSQARRDREEAVRYAAAGFAGDLLATADNLERAIASVPEDRRADDAISGLLAGVEATHRALLDAFAKHGVRRLDPLGERFDPHWHQASFEVTDARYPPGIVATVIQPGYTHHDRLLRPALVGVTKTPEGFALDPLGPAAPDPDSLSKGF